MAGGQDARQVSGKPAAGDVREGVDVERVPQCQAVLGVDGGGCEKLVEERSLEPQPGALEQDLAGEREAVGMEAGRGDAEHRVGRPHPGAVEDAGLLHHADAETGQVVLAFGVEPGQLRRFAADEGTAGPDASFGDAGDDLLAFLGAQLAGREVVEEDERLGPADHHVVDAHRHQIDADRLVPAALEGDLQLGADAVGARDQDRLGVTAGDLEKSAESADPGEDLGPHRAAGVGLDPLDQRIPLVDVHARVAVGERHGGRAP